MTDERAMELARAYIQHLKDGTPVRTKNENERAVVDEFTEDKEHMIASALQFLTDKREFESRVREVLPAIIEEISNQMNHKAPTLN